MSYLPGIAPPLWGHQPFDISRFNITWDQSTTKFTCFDLSPKFTAYQHYWLQLGIILDGCPTCVGWGFGGREMAWLIFFFDEEKKCWPLMLRNPALCCWGFGVQSWRQSRSPACLPECWLTCRRMCVSLPVGEGDYQQVRDLLLAFKLKAL